MKQSSDLILPEAYFQSTLLNGCRKVVRVLIKSNGNKMKDRLVKN